MKPEITKKIKNLLRQSLGHFGICLVNKPPIFCSYPRSESTCSFLMAAHHFVQQKQTCCFVQVGAFDGVSFDPIYALANKHSMTGLVIEPNPEAAAKLRENYARLDGVVVAEVAVDNRIGERDYFRVRPEFLPLLPFAGGLSGFSPNIIKKHYQGLVSDCEKVYETIMVPTSTLDALLVSHDITDPDFMVIDTEGFDFEILKLIPFNSIKPALIRFEHTHLSRSDSWKAWELLIQNGYVLNLESEDTNAYLPSRLGL